MKSQREKIITGISFLVFIFTVFFFSTSTFAAPKTYKMTYSFWGPTTESMAVVAKEYIAEIEKRSNGRVKITFFPGGSLTRLPQAYEGAAKGISTMALFLPAYSPGRFRLLRAFDLPLRIPSADIATKVYIEAFKKFNPAETADTKIMYTFGVGNTMLLSTKPINGIGDLKGMKIRALGTSGQYVSALGGTPVGMRISDVYEALQKNIVDASLNTPNVLYDFKFADHVKYACDWGVINASFMLAMNLRVWNSLPEDLKQIFEEANDKFVYRQVELWNRNENRGLEYGKSRGMQLVPLTPEIDAQLKAAAQPMYDKYISDMEDAGLPGKEFLEYIFKLAEKYK